MLRTFARHFLGIWQCCVAAAVALGWMGGKTVGQTQALSVRRDPGPVANSELAYRFEQGQRRYADLVRMRDGSLRIGKAMEWATQILLFDPDGGVEVLNPTDVDRIEFRRERRHKVQDNLPDLTVGYVERLPRDPHWHGTVQQDEGLQKIKTDSREVKWRPAANDALVIRVHVLNAGLKASAPILARVSQEGQAASDVKLPAIPPGKDHVFEVKVAYQDGPQTLKVELDPENSQSEALRWNNTFSERMDAQSVTVAVARQRYEAHRTFPSVVDSFCFEDWMQHQVRVLNGLLAASVHPSAPEGVQQRLRLDRIVIVEDPLDEEEAPDWYPQLHRQNGPGDGLAEYAALVRLGNHPREALPAYEALKVDWSMLQSILRQLGLIDLHATDTRVDQCMAMDTSGGYIQRRHLFPNSRTVMYTAAGVPLDERSAGYLNQTLNQPRGLAGSFLYQLPKSITLEVLANDAQPLKDVQVDVYQLMSEGPQAGTISGYEPGDPIYSATTDERGQLALPDQDAPQHETADGYHLGPNPFGKIAVDESNGLMLLKLTRQGGEEHHFLRLYDCNVARLRGERENYVHRIDTRFGSADDLPALRTVEARMEDRTKQPPPMYLRWPLPVGGIIQAIEDVQANIAECRVYRRTSLAGESERPWQLVDIVRRKGEIWIAAQDFRSDQSYFDRPDPDPRYSQDTFFSASLVDFRGRETSLAPPAVLAHGNTSVKFAIDKQGVGYITMEGVGELKLLQWNGVRGTHEYGVRTVKYPRYRPSYSGIAVTPDGRLVMTDPDNGCLGFYDHANLTELVPDPAAVWDKDFDRRLLFKNPRDVAADDAGRLYVADTGNDRVAVLDNRGEFLLELDEKFEWYAPQAAAYANGHICVTDRRGTRCRVYDVSGQTPKFVYEVGGLQDADRGLYSKKGRVYITGRKSQDEKIRVLVYETDGQAVTLKEEIDFGVMGNFHEPRGMYLYPTPGEHDFGYFVNNFPFDLRRVEME